ncbi:MAG: O-succinylbenzoate synthase [Candidatus Nanopelagicaceae bacterium]|nr:O-succinylbenzoate synthase [Candidatus Nanopelagicaceae bacterium]
MLNEILATLQVLSLPTRTNFRSVTKREVALFKGPSGWGEFSPFLEYGKDEAAYWLGAGIEAAFGELPKLQRDEIEINATLPAVDSQIDVERILSWYPGAKVVKIKVGDDLEADLNRIQHAINFNDNLKIRLDVNGGWSVKQAEDSIAQIVQRFGLERFEYIEQPVATLQELKELNLPIPVAGDEVIRKAKDPFSVDLQGAVDILMLKVSPLGGIARSLAIAKHHNLPIVVSSALESAVGISQGIKLAAALPQLNYACGLATGKLLSNDVAELPIIAGRMKVSEVHPTGMLNFQAAPERITWWKNRIRDSFEVWQARN